MQAAKPGRIVIAEVCHPSKPFCPWIKKGALQEPLQQVKPEYVGFDVTSLSKKDSESGILSERGMSDFPLRRIARKNVGGGRRIRLSLNDGCVSEFYLSMVASNPTIPLTLIHQLVSEAARTTRAGGHLVFFNGYYTPRGRAVLVDFEKRAAEFTVPPMVEGHGLKKEDCTMARRIVLLTNAVLSANFTPLGLEAHRQFLGEHGLGVQTELEPGVHISVFSANR